MTGTAFYFIQAMLMILLAVVGALVLWLHFQFQRFKKADKSLPALSDSLSENLLAVQNAMQALSDSSRSQMPMLEKKIQEAHRAMTDLDFMISRAEKTFSKSDDKMVADVAPKRPDFSVVETPTVVESVKEEVGPVVDQVSEVEETAKPKRMVTAGYGMQAYGSSISRDEDKPSEVEQDLRKVLEGRL